MNEITILDRFEDMKATLIAAGYDCHYVDIDAECVTEHPAFCSCGNPDPMAYRGYRRNDSYRAFIVCSECGAYEEF